MLWKLLCLLGVHYSVYKSELVPRKSISFIGVDGGMYTVPQIGMKQWDECAHCGKHLHVYFWEEPYER